MGVERIQALLDELHSELEAPSEGQLDPETAEKLTAVRGDIEGWLADTSADEAEGLAERARTAIGQFEAEHPTLTAVVNRIADALAAMGI